MTAFHSEPTTMMVNSLHTHITKRAVCDQDNGQNKHSLADLPVDGSGCFALAVSIWLHQRTRTQGVVEDFNVVAKVPTEHAMH